MFDFSLSLCITVSTCLWSCLCVPLMSHCLSLFPYPYIYVTLSPCFVSLCLYGSLPPCNYDSMSSRLSVFISIFPHAYLAPGIPFSLSLSIILSVFLTLLTSVALPLFLSATMYIFLSLHVSPIIYLSSSLYLCLPVSLFRCFSFSQFPCLSVSLSLFLSLSLSFSISR